MKQFLRVILIFILTVQPVFCYEAHVKTYNADVEGEIINVLKIEPVYVSLDECLQIALANNFNLKSSMATYQMTKWNFNYSLTHLLPEFAINAYATYYKGQLLVGGALIDELEEVALFGGGRLSHDLTKGGWTIFEIMVQKNLKKAQWHKTGQAKETVLHDTAVAYYNLLQAKVDIENYMINLDERKYQYEIAKARYEVGEGEKFDVVRTEIEVRKGEVDLLSAVTTFRLYQIKLSNLMGIEVNSPLMPIEKEIKEYTLIEEYETIDTLYAYALEISPVIRNLESEIVALKDKKYQYLSEIIPKADVYAQYSFQGRGGDGLAPNTTLGINLNIPFGDNLFAGTFAKMKAMQMQIESKEYTLEQTKRDIRENIIKSFVNSQKTDKKIDLVEEELEMSEVSTEIATGKYFEGEGILLDVIQAQTSKLTTRISLSKAKIDYNIHQIELLYYTGIITLENVTKGYNP